MLIAVLLFPSLWLVHWAALVALGAPAPSSFWFAGMTATVIAGTHWALLAFVSPRPLPSYVAANALLVMVGLAWHVIAPGSGEVHITLPGQEMVFDSRSGLWASLSGFGWALTFLALNTAAYGAVWLLDRVTRLGNG